MAILSIICGIILISVYFPGNFMQKIGKFLDPAGGVLGLILLFFGVTTLIPGGLLSWEAWTMTLAGILLGSRLIPAMKDMANFINPAGGIVGIAAILLPFFGNL